MNLEEIEENSVPFFNVKGLYVQCRCVNVTDNNRYVIIFEYNKSVYKWVCQLNDVYLPSIHSMNINERKYARSMFTNIRNKLINKIMYIKCHEFSIGKEMKLNIEIFINNVSFNKLIIDNKYGLTYEVNWGNYALSRDVYLTMMR